MAGTRAIDYGLAVAAVAAAVLLRALLDPWLGDNHPLTTVFAAVALAVWVGGWRPAVLVTALGYLVCDWLFVPPRDAFLFDQLAAVVGTLSYLLSCAVVIGFGEAMRSARRRADAHRRQVQQEVDQRARAEDALRHRTEELERLLHVLPAAVWIAHDPDCRTVTGNSHAERLLGLKSGANVSSSLPPAVRRWSRLLRHGRELARDEFPLQRTMATGRGLEDFEFEWELVDGRVIPLLCNTVPLHDAAGRVRGAVAACLDVSTLKAAERQVRESETRFRIATEAAGMFTWECDLVAGTMRWSDNAAALLGCRPEDLPADVRAGHFFVQPDDSRRLVAEYARAVAARQELAAYEFRGRGAADAERHYQSHVRVVYDDRGAPVRSIGVTQDVTERKRTEAAFRASEERLRVLAEAVPVMVWACRPDGSVLYLNRRWAEYTGQRAEEYQGFGWADVLHPDDRGGVLARWEYCTRTGALYEGEARYRRHDGTYRWHYFRGVPVRGADGAITAWYGASLDIEDKKAAEYVLRESEQRFKTMADTAPAMLWITDPDGACTFLSRGWYEFTGQSEAEALGAGWLDAVHSDDRERAARVFHGANARHEPFALDYRLRRADGAYRWAIDAGRPRSGPAGEFLGFIGSVIDVHERKQAEDELRRLNAELREADRRKDEFLATLAHELRNPLAPIRNAVQILIAKGPEDPSLAWSRTVIDRQVRQMARLLDDLLDVSRITRNKLELRKARVSLAGIVESALETSRPLIDAGGHELAIALPADPVYLDADPVRLAQVFSNLLNNAAKYTGHGRQIRLAAEVRPAADEVVVTVRDSGIGIGPDVLPRVFEMFSQAESALERSQGGLGIGLSLVKGLIEMHGGRITAHSDGPGLGSTFTVGLPLAAGPRPTPTVTPEVPDRPGPGARLRVLVVDDLRESADTLAMLLRLSGHEVHTAYDGAEAVAAAERLRPDVALLDLGMPNLNGYDACRQIRTRPWGERMRLVALTGWGQDEDRRRTEDAGFDHHLVKPVDPADLYRVLAAFAAGAAFA